MKRSRANEDLEPNMYTTTAKGKTYFYWQNPLTFQKEPLGRDRDAAIVTARALNRALATMGIDPNERAPRPTGMTMAELVKEYQPRAMEKLKSDNSRKHTKNVLARIERIYGDLGIVRATVKDLADPIDPLPNSTHNDIRTQLVAMFAYALARGHIPHHLGNAASFMEKRSDPKPTRQRLSYDDFRRIREAAEPWLQVAMDIMLHTGLRPCDVVPLRYEQIVGNVLYTQIRKTQKFLGIELGETEMEIITRSRADGIASPYVVHRHPKRRTGKRAKNKNHSTQLTLDKLSRTFSELRTSLGIGESKSGTPPTLYEIRSLSSRMYAAMGRDKKEIRDLLAHTHEKMTDVYLDPRDIEKIVRDNVPMVRTGLVIDHHR